MSDPDQFFSSNLPADTGVLEDLQFSPKDMEKACSELRATAAAGPDGVPAILLKSLHPLESIPGQWDNPP